MWIRSQDGTSLDNVTNLFIYHDNDSFFIKSYAPNMKHGDSALYLGEYKTKARAKRVLDDIEGHIRDMYIHEYSPSTMSAKMQYGFRRHPSISDYVFHMPKE